ncbi:MAG: HAD hydrolase-like protein [Opitutales bacterium]|nr:HAD hydrolase-like protein [Opitutales bacterium]
MNYEHIIWDWNGTVIDDARLCVQILNDELLKRGLPVINLEFYQENFSFPVNLFYKKIGLPSMGIRYEELNLVFITQYKKYCYFCNLHADVQFVLNKLTNAGVAQSVLSAGKETDIIEFVKYFKLLHCFSTISGVRNIRASGKKEISESHRQKIRCSTDKILLIGDTVHDLEIADHLGIDCILFSNGHNSHDVLLAKTSRVINSYEKLLQFIS